MYSLPIYDRYAICALILLGCAYIAWDAFTNFVDLAFMYHYRKKPVLGLGYLCGAIFFCTATVVFVLPNFEQILS